MKILQFFTCAALCSMLFCSHLSCFNCSAQTTGTGEQPRNITPEQRQRLRQFIQRRRAARDGGAVNAGAGADASASAGAGLGAGSGLGARMGAGRGAAVVIDPKIVKVEKDVAYGTAARQKLDIYSPVKSDGKLPVVLFAHGGGWQRGSKDMHREKGKTYAENGVIFVATNYRLAPDVMHPKQIQDIASAFAWVKKHATELGADDNRIFIMGHSAGAQLVDLLGTNERFLAEQGLSLKDIKGVISLDTASLNLAERMNESTNEAAMVGGMISNAFGTGAKVLADASPTLCIHAGQAYPFFLMFCGEKRKSCVAQHERFSNALKKAGGQVTVKVVPLSHGEISKTAGQAEAPIFKDVIGLVKNGK